MPKLALMKHNATNVVAFVHAGSPRSLAIESTSWPERYIATAAAMVKSVAMKLPPTSQERRLAPMWSPMRPMKAPALKARREARAC